MVNKWVLMTMINGLHDGETQQSVLSKVEEMNLEDTIVFVEAREVGRHSVKILNGGLTSSQVNRVNVQDTGTCSYCGKKGHGKNSHRDIRRTDCPAWGRMCKKCKQKNHFTDLCTRKGDKKEESPKDTTKTAAGANHVTINAIKMLEKGKSGKVSRVTQSRLSQTDQDLIKKT